MKIKKWIAAGLATIMMTGMLTGCGKNHINLVGASGRKCF